MEIEKNVNIFKSIIELIKNSSAVMYFIIVELIFFLIKFFDNRLFLNIKDGLVMFFQKINMGKYSLLFYEIILFLSVLSFVLFSFSAFTNYLLGKMKYQRVNKIKHATDCILHNCINAYLITTQLLWMSILFLKLFYPEIILSIEYYLTNINYPTVFVILKAVVIISGGGMVVIQLFYSFVGKYLEEYELYS